jgi:hypothetical protein
MAFPTKPPATLTLQREALSELAAEETSFGRIMVDERGITAGTRQHILEPVRAVTVAWKDARRPFDVAIQPVLAAIDAVREVPQEVLKCDTKRKADRAQAHQEFESNSKFIGIQERFHNADSRY